MSADTGMIALPILDTTVATDLLLEARHNLCAVRDSTLSGTELYARCTMSVVHLDEALKEVSS